MLTHWLFTLDENHLDALAIGLPLLQTSRWHDMNGRTSRLQTFLVRFGELKAAAGNDPKALCSFDQTTAEIRAAAR